MSWDRFEPFQVAFSALDLDARLASRIEASIAFDVEWNGHDHEGAFRKGWIDVHYPCRGRIRAMVRVALSVPYDGWEAHRAIVDAIFLALEIPPGTAYEALFFTPTNQVALVNDPDSHYSYL